MRTASIVVVGAGAVGASVAFHLAARGARDVVVLDRAGGPGEGSTGRATGGFRAQFGSEVNVRLSLLSRARLARFAEETGVDPAFRPAGYLWLAVTDADMTALRAGLAVQHAAGLLESREVGVEDVMLLNPAVEPGACIGGAYCPTDGFVSPLRLVEGYLAAAARHGARVEWRREVLGFDPAPDGRVGGVRTADETVAAGAVVNAAGPWASRLAAAVGVELPVTPLRRQVAVLGPRDILPETMPMTLWVDDGFHLRVRDGRVLLLLPSPGVPGRPFDDRVDDEWIARVTRRAGERVPAVRGLPVDRAACWGGLYEMSPDRHAILGASPSCPNFYLANGSSGHGVMHAPALGALLAEIILDGAARSLDARALRPTRFAEGAPNPADGVL